MDLFEGLVIADRYKLLEKLGGGSFSEVWKANDMILGPDSIFALKIFNIGKDTDADYEMFINEFKLMCNLDHNNLLSPKYYEKWNDITFLVLKYCESGSCEKLIGKFTEDQAIRFLHDVASGLKYLHNLKSPIIHQDIKPDNVLIDHDGFVLTDFGVSTKTKKTVSMKEQDTNNAGTVSYLAPERFNKSYIPITSSDIWSLGATVFELITGYCPFGNDGGITQIDNDIPDLPKKYSKNLNKLIKLCLSKDPWDRLKAEEIVDITNYYLKNKSWKFPERYKQTTKYIKRYALPVSIITIVTVLMIFAITSIYTYSKKRKKNAEYKKELSTYINQGDIMLEKSCTDDKSYFVEVVQSKQYYEKAVDLKRSHNDTVGIYELNKKINRADSIRIVKFNIQITGAKLYLNVDDKKGASTYLSNASTLAETQQEKNLIKTLKNE